MSFRPEILAVPLYCVAVGALLFDVVRRGAELRRWALGLLILAFVLQTYGLVGKFSAEFARGVVPGAGASELFHLLSWVFVAIVLMLQSQSRLFSIGSFLAVFGLLCGVAALLLPDREELLTPGFPGFLFAAHLGTLFVGIGSLCLSSLTALVYLLKHRELKLKKFGRLLAPFPSLSVLDRVTIRTLVLGVAALTLGIATGVFVAHYRWEKEWPESPKVVFSAITYAWYLGLIVVRWKLGWRGGRFFFLVGVGFLILIFTFLGTLIFFPAIKIKETSELLGSGLWTLSS